MNYNLYKPSGKIGAKSIFVIPFAFVGALLVSWLYTMALFFNPIIYLSFVILAGACFGLGWLARKMIVLGHVRNIGLSFFIGALLGLSVTYVSHAELYAHLFTDLNVIEFSLNPILMWDTANYIAEVGYFEIEGSAVDEEMLWAIWGLEALGLIATPIFMAFTYATSRVYCEHCNNWAEEDTDLFIFGLDDQNAAKSQFLNGDLTFLNNAYPLTKNEISSAGEHFTIDEEWCKKCGKTHALSLRKNTRRIDKGKLVISQKTLVEDLLISEELHNFVQNTSKQIVQ